MAVRCYFLNPTDRVARYLRRYVSGSGCTAPGQSYHNAMVRIEDDAAKLDADGHIMNGLEGAPLEDPRWPVACACGYQFGETDERQLFVERIHTRSDNGAETTIRDAGPGAMWDAGWLPWKGPDGRALTVKCPNGREWFIDGQCSNCTMPEDTMQAQHHCWTRTGEPPNIIVGKEYGPTCSAGGGSIQAGDYHGFLVNGEFSE